MRDAVQRLTAFYGPLAAPPADLFAFVVWEIVGARTSPARRDIAWTALKRLPALTPDAMFRTATPDLEAALAMLPGRQERVDQLRAVSLCFRRHRELADRVAGSMLSGWRALAEVPGLAKPARLRALLFAGGHATAPADDGILRVMRRLHGLAAGHPVRSRRLARARFASGCAGDLALLKAATVAFAHHAAHACAEASPHCAVCPLADGCRYAAAGRVS